MKTVRLSTLLLALSCFLPAHAAVPLASRDDDRIAKHARPDAGRALIYVYSTATKDAAAIIVSSSRGDSAALYPQTFSVWSVAPGRIELRAAGSGASTTLTSEAGRVYYVELMQSSSGVTLRSVPFATGRAQVQRSRLMAKPSVGPKTEATGQRPPAAPRARSPAEPSRWVVALMLGSLKPTKTMQTVLTAERRFDSASSALAIEAEWFLRPYLSLGAELISYSNDYTTISTGSTGQADTTALLFNVKRYFSVDSTWQPYIGASLGGAGADFSGSIAGSTGGLAWQLVAGLQWRMGRVGWRAEYKKLNADTEDASGQKIDMSGSGVFIGAGLNF